MVNCYLRRPGCPAAHHTSCFAPMRRVIFSRALGVRICEPHSRHLWTKPQSACVRQGMETGIPLQVTLEGHGADRFRLGVAAGGSVETLSPDEFVVGERRHRGDGVGIARWYDCLFVFVFFHHRGYCVLYCRRNVLFAQSSCLLCCVANPCLVSRLVGEGGGLEDAIVEGLTAVCSSSPTGKNRLQRGRTRRKGRIR